MGAERILAIEFKKAHFATWLVHGSDPLRGSRREVVLRWQHRGTAVSLVGDNAPKRSEAHPLGAHSYVWTLRGV